MSRKLSVMLIAFALVIVSALIGCGNKKDSPDDRTANARPAPKNGSPTTANTTSQPVAELSTIELPLYPDSYPISIIIKGQHRANNDYAGIYTIVDGYKKTVYVEKEGSPIEEILTFRLRTDGWKHASVQLSVETLSSSHFNYSNICSAVVLVPDEESLKLWQEWMAREVKRQRGDRVYPARVLPPK